MIVCERCRSDEARCCPAGVNLCYGCASDLHVFDAEHGLVGQTEQASFFCDVPGPYSMGKKVGEAARSSDAGQAAANAPGAIAKTADAAGQIAKTVRVVGVILAVGGAAWVGYALWKAKKEATGLQHGAQQAFLAHPELLRI